MVGMYLLAPSLAVVSVLSLGGASGRQSSAAQPEAMPHAKPKLIAEHNGVRPATKTWLGITFDIEPHWHIYWDGDGDTGQPVKAQFTLPPGCKVSEIVWPTPTRQVIGDTIIDYIYEERVTLLVQLETPEALEPGTPLKIAAALNWMECADECIPRKATVSLDLPVISISQEPEKSPNAVRFEETRRRLPRSVEETAKTVKAEWRGDTLSLSVPGAKGMIFYPHRTSAKLADAIEHGERKKDRLELEIKSGKDERVLGILEVVRSSDAGQESKPRSEFFAIDLSRDSSSAAEPTDASRNQPPK